MKEYIKNFDEWNIQRKMVQKNSVVESCDFFFHEKEVWWSALGVNIGVEMDGKNENFERPVLVLRKINDQQFYGIPVTSKDKKGEFYIKFIFGNNKNKNQGKVCLSQVRVFSTKRLLRKIGKSNLDDFKNIKKVFVDFFSDRYE